MTTEPLIELECLACTWHLACDGHGIDRQLRGAGLLLDEKTPSPAALAEMIAGASARLTCPECRTEGLAVRPYHAGDGDWQEAVTCEICRRPIPLERLEALPDTRRCVKCQQEEERGATRAEPEYCPKCGSLLTLRVSHGTGGSKFKMFCTGSPPCRL